MVAPVVGHQRDSSTMLDSQYSAMAAQQAMPPVSLFDVGSMSSGMSVGGNVTMLIPGRQPLFAVSAVGSDVPTLMSQLVLAGASVQNSVMAGALPSQAADCDERPGNAC